MKIESLDPEGDRHRYRTDGSNASLSALRRSIMADVETLAIEDVDIYENTTVLYDEVLAHRLGLVPLETEPGEFLPPGECQCEGEGCANCQAQLSLQAEAPEEGSTTVYSGDIAGDVEAADPDIPIVRLREGQRLLLNAIAQLGQGTDHIKWSGAVAAALTEDDDGTRVLTYETDGSMTSDELLEQAIDKQVQKLDELLDAIDELT